jgi:hypothetical protein
MAVRSEYPSVHVGEETVEVVFKGCLPYWFVEGQVRSQKETLLDFGLAALSLS